MGCSRHNEEQLTDFVTGRLAWGTAWRLRRHLAGCTECRTHWEQTRQIWTSLQGMASAPVPQTVHDRVVGRWPTLLLKKGTYPMKKRAALLACSLSLIGVTAAMAAHVIHYHPSGEFSSNQQVWNYSTNLKGKMTVLNGQGGKIGVFTNDGAFMTDAAGPASAWVKMNVAGQDHLIQGPGRHEIKDANGTLLGYVVLSDVSEAETYREMGWPRAPHDFAEAAKWEEERDPASGGGTSGVTTSVTGVRGFDKVLGVSWKMRGYGTVAAKHPDGTPSAEGSTQPEPPILTTLLPPGFVPDPASPPQFTLTVQGKTVQETGYGRHILKDSNGKPLLILEAKPFLSK